VFRVFVNGGVFVFVLFVYSLLIMCDGSLMVNFLLLLWWCLAFRSLASCFSLLGCIGGFYVGFGRCDLWVVGGRTIWRSFECCLRAKIFKILVECYVFRYSWLVTMVSLGLLCFNWWGRMPQLWRTWLFLWGIHFLMHHDI